MNNNPDTNSSNGSLVNSCSTESIEESFDPENSQFEIPQPKGQSQVSASIEYINDNGNAALKKAWDMVVTGIGSSENPRKTLIPVVPIESLDFIEETCVNIQKNQLFPQLEFAAYYSAIRITLGMFRKKKVDMQEAWDDWLEYKHNTQINPFVFKSDLIKIGEDILNTDNPLIWSYMEEFDKKVKYADWFTICYSYEIKSILPEMKKLWAWSKMEGNNPIRVGGIEAGIAIGMMTMDFDLMLEALSIFDKLPYNIGIINNEVIQVARQWIKTNEMGGEIILKSFVPFNLDHEKNLIKHRYRVIIEPILPVWPTNPLDMVFRTLDKEFPWMHRVTRLLHLSMQISMNNEHRVFKFRPVLLVGPPASGKSHFARRMVELLGMPSLGLSGSGMTDDKILMGVTRGWNSARPGVLAELLVKNPALNPLVIFDELDKVTENTNNGSAWNALLTMIEPRDAKQHYDPYFMGEMDISNFSWLFLANSTRHLPEPLLTRLSVVNVDRPSGNQIIDVGWSMWHVIGKESGLPWQQWPEITDNDMLGIVKNFGDSNLRRLRRALDALFYKYLEAQKQDIVLQ